MRHGLPQLAVVVAAAGLRCDGLTIEAAGARGLIINATEARPNASNASAARAGARRTLPACEEGGLEFDGVLYPCPCPVPNRGAGSISAGRWQPDHTHGSTSVGRWQPDHAHAHVKRSFIPCWVLLGAGSLMYLFGRPGIQLTAAIFVLYFGAQMFLTFYMKFTLSGFHLSSSHPEMRGMPAPFLITALQQFISFVIVVFASFLSRPTRWSFGIGFSNFTRRKVLFIVGMSLSFTLSVGLNALALCVLDISVNLAIRSLGPLAIACIQQLQAWWSREGWIDVTRVELALLMIGTLGAVLAVLAKTIFVDSGTSSANTTAGVFICIASLVASSFELIVAGMMGGEMKMSPVEVIACTSVPTVLFLVLPLCFLPHPTAWPGTGLSTDLSVVRVVFELNPRVFALAAYSGIFACIYNGVLFTCVQQISAIQAAFAGNTNKAGTIILGMLLGVEAFPHGFCGALLTIGLVLNISSFAAHTMANFRRRQSEQRPPKQL